MNRTPTRTRTFAPRASRLAPLALAAALGAASYGGCSGKEVTEIVSGVSTQMRVPKDIQTVGVVIQREGKVLFCQGYDVVEQIATLPATMALAPAELELDEALSSEPVTTTYYGFTTKGAFDDCVAQPPEPKQVATGDAATDAAHGANTTLRVMRRARTPYADGRVMYLPMPLRDACAGVACDKEGEACVGGLCTSIDVTPDSLADFREDFIDARDGSTCFSVATCMPDALQRTASLTDPGSCSFTIPTPPGAPLLAGSTNVMLTYDTFSVEVLDLDANEGFIVDDPTKPQNFRLSPALCGGPYAKGRILSVSGAVSLDGLGPRCSSKTPLQPICLKDLLEIQAGKVGPQAASPTLCSIPESSLDAADSALYVLLDRSPSMAKFLNNQPEFQKAVEFTIDNPITKATRVAFAFLPGDKTEGNVRGGSSDYADPRDVEPRFGTRAFPESDPRFEGEVDFEDDGFALAELAQEAISAELSFDASAQTSNPNLADEGAPLALDEVMAFSNAYAALAALTSKNGFNRRALLILSNSLLLADCAAVDGKDDPTRAAVLAELAATAKESGLSTYVIPLVRQGERDGGGVDVDDNGFQDGDGFPDVDERAGSAQAIAKAGGTVFRNAADPDSGDLEGAKKLQEIVNDLGSCVYNISERQVVLDALEGDDAHLSYLSPVDQTRVDIPKNAACTEASQAAYDELASHEGENELTSPSANSGWHADADFVRICGTACAKLRERLSTASLTAGALSIKAPSVPVVVSQACK